MAVAWQNQDIRRAGGRPLRRVRNSPSAMESSDRVAAAEDPRLIRRAARAAHDDDLEGRAEVGGYEAGDPAGAAAHGGLPAFRVREVLFVERALRCHQLVASLIDCCQYVTLIESSM